MISAIAGWSLRFRYLVLGIAGVMMVFGILQLPKASVDVLPEFTPSYVEVQTEALGLSAEEVEQLITVPLEADLLAGVAWLDVIRSDSLAGLSSIVLIFEPGTDVFRARQMVAERLTQAHALPNVSKPPTMLQPLASNNRLMMVALSSDDVSLIDMSVLARWTIRPRLMGVAGVANVAVWGQRERQLQVQVDPQQLSANGVTLDEIIETTGNALWFSPLTFLDASTPGTGGFIDTPNQRLGVQHVSPIRTSDDLARVTFVTEGSEGGERRTLTLGQVARVVEDHQPLIGDALVQDGTGLLLVIEKFPGADSVAVTRSVEDALQALGPGLAGIRIDTQLYRPASFIESAVQNLAVAILIGLMLVGLVLLTIGFYWRAALVCLVSIIVSLTAAAVVIYVAGATVNAMLVAGIVLGVAVVIDDAIVGVDEIVRRPRPPSDVDGGAAISAVVRESAIKGRGALAYATAIIALAILPVFFIPGAAGAFTPHVAAAYLVAILASMIIAVTVTPALASVLLSGSSAGRREAGFIRRFQSSYGSLLKRFIARTRTGLVAVGLLTVVVVTLTAITAAPQIGGSLVPSFRERDLLVRWEAAPGTSHPEMSRLAADLATRLRAIPGIRNVGGTVGRAVTSDQVVAINSGETWANIDPAADYHATAAAMDEVVHADPEIEAAVMTYPSDRIAAVLGGVEDDVVIRVYGQDLAILTAKAEEVREALTGIDGLRDENVSLAVTEPTIRVEVDLPAAELHGLQAGDVRRAATTLLSGIEVGSLFEEQKVFEVVVWGVPEIRQDLASVGDLLIDTPSGTLVRLGDLATVSVVGTPSVIQRESVFRYVDVGATIDGRGLDTVLADVQTRIGQLEFPLEYHVSVTGGAAPREAAITRLLALIAAVTFGILLVLQAAFNSWRLAAFVVIILPTALIGGAAGLLATGGTVSLGLFAGFFAVLALAARQSITLIDHLRRTEQAHGSTPDADVVVRGAQERLLPVLVTALATAAAFLPMLVLGDIAGLEIVRPMAAVIIGGLFSSTVLTLTFVPAVYLRLGPSSEQETVEQLVADQPGLSPA
ncbi:MAG: efflux RND transporter permease subunit [Candidatus Limnocylindrales bacterium]